MRTQEYHLFLILTIARSNSLTPRRGTGASGLHHVSVISTKLFVKSLFAWIILASLLLSPIPSTTPMQTIAVVQSTKSSIVQGASQHRLHLGLAAKNLSHCRNRNVIQRDKLVQRYCAHQIWASSTIRINEGTTFCKYF